MANTAQALNMLEMLKKSYLEELPSRIGDLENLVLELGRSGSFSEQFQQLFRAVHSLKGTAGTYGFHLVSTICHRLEDHLHLVDGDETRFQEGHRERWLAHIDLMQRAVGMYAQNVDDHQQIERALDGIRASVFVQNRRGMLIERSKSTAMLCQQALSELPIKWVVMSDGLAALERLVQEKFDVVVTGMEIGKLNALSLISALRLSSCPSRNAFTVVLTSSATGPIPPYAAPEALLKRDAQLGVSLPREVANGLKLG